MQEIEHLAQSAGVLFVSGVWQGFVLAVIVGLCLRLAPKAPAALRFAIWSVVLVVVAALPFLEQFYAGHAARTSATNSLVQLDVRWSFAIAAVWMAMSLFRAADLGVHAVRLWSLRHGAMPVALEGAVLAVGMRRVMLCTSAEVDRPSVVGFFAPRILIPEWLYAQLTASELEQIVLHEMEHLRRGDDWLNLFQKLSLVLFPLNPIVLWVERRLCFERELACDDGVLRRTRAPRAYATCLTSLAERGLNRQTVSLALGVVGEVVRESELAQRVHRILRRETTLSPMRTRMLTGAVSLGLLGGVVALGRCPQVISFAAPVQPTRAAAAAPMAPVVGDRASRSNNIERVSFGDSDAPHMTLLTAAMQQSPMTSKPAMRKARRIVAPAAVKAPAVQKLRASVNSQRDSSAGWVVLSSWTEDARQPVMVPVVDNNNVLLPYAAVPTAGGWVLIQL